MAATSAIGEKTERDIFYYRRRFQNRVHEMLTAFFEEEAERRAFTRVEIAESINRDPAQISRWLAAPSNLTLDTISDLLLAVDAEMDVAVARFDERPTPNEMHPLIAKIANVDESQKRIIRANRQSETASGSRNPSVRELEFSNE